MIFNQIPVEQTTSATDLLLAILCVIFAFSIYNSGRLKDKKKATLWAIIYSLLGLASLLGAVAHGLNINESTKFLLWQPLNLSLGVMIGLFIVAVFYDWKGSTSIKRMLPLMIAISIIFYTITIFSEAFLVFILYELIAMLFSITIYAILGFKKTLPGSIYIVLGILVTIIAAGIQTQNSINFTLIWQFNHNGLYHLIQIVGLLLIFVGVQKSFANNKLLLSQQRNQFKAQYQDNL